jgi:septal ring factor EnvC (AmiA/AmiB activator)
MNPLLQQPFFQVTLPIIIAMVATVWALSSTNNRRLDDIRADLKAFREEINADVKAFREEMNAELKEIRGEIKNTNGTLKGYGQQIAVLEERTSPLGRRG